MKLLTLPHDSLDWNPPLVVRWTSIGEHSGKPDPFSCTPAWQLAFHDAFEPSRRLLLHVDGENVLAFAELILDSGQILLVPPEDHWVSGCPLLGPDADGLFAQALPFLLHEYGGRLPCFLLGGLEERSLLITRIFRRFAGRFRFLQQPFSLQRSASLAGGMDGYLSRRSGNFRANIRKARKRAAASRIRFERLIPATPEDADRTYARMTAVEEKSWKGKEHCGMTESPSREFYHAMIRRLSRYGGARVIFAMHEDSDIGFIFGGMAGTHYRGQQFSYDDAWKRFSIGDLLQMEQLSWLCEEHTAYYDMGMSDHPSMAYKTHWAEAELALHAWLLIPEY